MNRCVIITGHLGGLGTALADCFSRAGFRVIGIDRSSNADLPFDQHTIDLATLVEPTVCSRLSRELASLIGSGDLVGLINNAAVQHLGPLDSLETRLFLESFYVNVVAPLNLARMLLPALKKTRGTVINVNSIHAHLTKPEFAPYSISKAAMAGLTRAMAVELGRDVRVLEVRPAAIATPMLEAGFSSRPQDRQRLDDYHPTGRIGDPAEVAESIRQLVEADSGFLNGAIVNIDGGISHRLHDP